MYYELTDMLMSVFLHYPALILQYMYEVYKMNRINIERLKRQWLVKEQ